ncbi:hypothetical protein H4R34_001194 [Dimargaris verticillata]|uniref:Extracellular membrane protein CFEM domain-containing protein n=1 Tax=Dimargaris verticillata TaxID=2761393 RepID=A0A9W8B582_9FUNG|nr:hypothetical protein H4R34_001194 [Dimargaris verticillata]
MLVRTSSLLALTVVVAATTVQAVDWIESAKELNSCVAQCHSTLDGQQAADCQLNCINNSPYVSFTESQPDSTTTVTDAETTKTETESTTESHTNTRTATDKETDESSTTDSEETNTDSGAASLGLTAALLAPVAAALLAQY